ncbi:hypothetical protein JMY81_03345 [Brenneria goodwinii]|uniref:hypothetical protein n=2 Tax=Brenneria goodwinii TaxID=1109412 RepID=UPI00065DEB46|nr:hypothetical protein [Brenneria goodwinii]ATA23571.1 hypothetical protein AWC36_05335 [Brenneria goodwinii]MCG8154791.1 hypothetical protein [Brenneria goodwinii]MCG8159872.1 hypothetical protein [Brenneria goodwinii]MCG8164029.1 hypothetical protein [Brenneria goodwinii]MCG8168638.1 hypothetical protein [Brenneria goodwinii]
MEAKLFIYTIIILTIMFYVVFIIYRKNKQKRERNRLVEPLVLFFEERHRELDAGKLNLAEKVQFSVIKNAIICLDQNEKEEFRKHLKSYREIKERLIDKKYSESEKTLLLKRAKNHIEDILKAIHIQL